MKILWLSNRVITKADSGSTGTWLFALANVINNTDLIHLGNITNDTVPNIVHNNFENIEQWLIPNKAQNRDGLPSVKYKKSIIKIIRDYNPDIIHVWGVEYYWGYITQNLLNEFPVLIEIQGLLKEIAPVIGGELTYIEKLRCIGLKELIKFDSIFDRSRKYKKWGLIEKKIIKNHTYFSTHSQWAEAKVKELNPYCVMFKNERLLRSEFYSAKKWEYKNLPVIFTSCGYSAPFKGLLTLIRSIEIIKHKYPNIVLRVAGAFQFDGIRRDGYMHFLRKYIEKNKLEKNILFVGPLNGNKIIEMLQQTSVAVYPSFVESYGLALAECMAVGTPVIAAFNGGYSYLGRDNENVLFFTPGDDAMCAIQIDRVLSNKNLAITLSENARKICLKRNNPAKIIDTQFSIYKTIYSTFNTNS